jgi:hypothetical protein
MTTPMQKENVFCVVGTITYTLRPYDPPLTFRQTRREDGPYTVLGRCTTVCSLRTSAERIGIRLDPCLSTVSVLNFHAAGLDS